MRRKDDLGSGVLVWSSTSSIWGISVAASVEAGSRGAIPVYESSQEHAPSEHLAMVVFPAHFFP